MSEHVIVWEFDHDCVTQRVECRAANDADCRLYCAEGCEEVYGIERDEIGDAWHAAGDFSESEKIQHRMTAMTGGDCNVALFLNEGGSIPEDAARNVGAFTLAETPIKPLWNGDTYEWERTTPLQPEVPAETQEARP